MKLRFQKRAYRRVEKQNRTSYVRRCGDVRRFDLQIAIWLNPEGYYRKIRANSIYGKFAPRCLKSDWVTLCTPGTMVRVIRGFPTLIGRIGVIVDSWTEVLGRRTGVTVAMLDNALLSTAIENVELYRMPIN